MRTENAYALARALGHTPATIDELKARTGLSYSTVKRGLAEIKAVRIEGSWPSKWSKPEHVEAPVPEGPSLTTEPGVLVTLVQSDDLLARWQERQEAFAAELRNLVVAPDTDPAKLSAALANGASALASLAYAIREHESKPDWYSILGGTMDSFVPDLMVS